MSERRKRSHSKDEPRRKKAKREKKQKEFEDITHRLDNLTKIVETLVSVQQEREPEEDVIDIARHTDLICKYKLKDSIRIDCPHDKSSHIPHEY